MARTNRWTRCLTVKRAYNVQNDKDKRKKQEVPGTDEYTKGKAAKTIVGPVMQRTSAPTRAGS